MSYKQNIVVSNGPVQLVDKSRFGNSVSQGGVTCTNNGDGSWTINGNVTAENRFNLNFYQLGANVIPYWLSPGVPVEHNYYTQDCYYDKLGGWLYYYLEEGKNYENFKIYPQIISLTATFGSGNEPKNKEQVKAKFPDDLYPYNPTNRVTTYKELIKVSDVCQLLDKSKYPATTTTNGVTFTNNGDGTITVSGNIADASGANASFPLNAVGSYIPVDNTHKYLGLTTDNVPQGAYIYVPGWKDNSPYHWVRDVGYIESNGFFYQNTDLNVTYISMSVGVNLNSTASYNFNTQVQWYDLTEMFGSGNEPKTVAEFKQKFPDELYPYSPNCWITSYKNVSKVGEVCQLVDKTKLLATQTQDGVTFTNNGDGTITLNGTATALMYMPITSAYIMIPLSTNKKYLLTGCPPNGSTSSYFLYLNNGGGLFDFDVGNGAIGSPIKSTGFVTIAIASGTVFDNLVFKPQLFDLTEMYGEGNEPKTVTEFREKFPEELYDYSPRCII